MVDEPCPPVPCETELAEGESTKNESLIVITKRRFQLSRDVV